MNANEVYKRQMTVTNQLLHGMIDGLRPGEWEARPAPGTNPIGFTLWHIPAVQDWAIRTFLGGELGLSCEPQWAAKGMATFPAPFGMTAEEADAIAAATRPEEVVAYADAVLEQSLSWLDGREAEDFERVFDTRAHLSLHPVYATEGYLEEAAGMMEYPAWRLMSGACYGHARGHFGELELALQLIRSR